MWHTVWGPIAPSLTCLFRPHRSTPYTCSERMGDATNCSVDGFLFGVNTKLKCKTRHIETLCSNFLNTIQITGCAMRFATPLCRPRTVTLLKSHPILTPMPTQELVIQRHPDVVSPSDRSQTGSSYNDFDENNLPPKNQLNAIATHSTSHDKLEIVTRPFASVGRKSYQALWGMRAIG